MSVNLCGCETLGRNTDQFMFNRIACASILVNGCEGVQAGGAPRPFNAGSAGGVGCLAAVALSIMQIVQREGCCSGFDVS